MKKLAEENLLGRIFILFIPTFLIILIGAFIVFDNFESPDKDTTNLTNYGFAILIGIASICFSWARNMDKEKEPKMLDKVTVAGEKSFHSSIIFLIASALKYSLINLHQFISKDSIFFFSMHLFLYAIFLICFAIAYVKFESVIRELNFLLYERLNQNKKN